MDISVSVDNSMAIVAHGTKLSFGCGTGHTECETTKVAMHFLCAGPGCPFPEVQQS